MDTCDLMPVQYIGSERVARRGFSKCATVIPRGGPTSMLVAIEKQGPALDES